MRKPDTTLQRDTAQLSAPEYEVLVQFIRTSMKPLGSVRSTEQELMVSLSFALQRHMRGC